MPNLACSVPKSLKAPGLARSVPKPLNVPSLARSVPKPLKVPSLARSVPKPLSIFAFDRRATDASLWNDDDEWANFRSLICMKLLYVCIFLKRYTRKCAQQMSYGFIVGSEVRGTTPQSQLWVKWSEKWKWSIFGPLFFLKLIYIIDHVYT